MGVDDELSERLLPCVQEAVDEERRRAEFHSDSLLLRALKICESRIEALFYVAYGMRVSRSTDSFRIIGPGQPTDLTPQTPDASNDHMQTDIMALQFPVEKFRADFAVCRSVIDVDPPDDMVVISPKVLVECDGHDFHERTKEQATHDKARDRVLQTHGFFVLRFTGSEIWRDPSLCAKQVDEFLAERIKSAILASREGK